MSSPKDLICFRCKHWRDVGGCVAFPEGIPDEIIRSNKHDEPLEGQKNDLVFEEKTDSE